MDSIAIEPTNQSPLVMFNVNGRLLLEGRCLPENVAGFFAPLFEFLSKLETEKVLFDVNLDYFNTATSKKLLEMFKCLDTNEKIQRVMINWHYEDGDDDSFEMAEIYQEQCQQRSKFKYIRHLETVPLEKRVSVVYLE